MTQPGPDPIRPDHLPPRYRLVGPLGRGGSCTVWLAEDSLGERRVAIKLLLSREHLDALRQELAVLGRLRHPCLPAVFELGYGRDGCPFLVSEYVEGEPLAVWWDGRPFDEVLLVVGQLLAVLDLLHRRQLVHRDVKPENVLVGRAGLRLVDFGLAQRLDADERAELGGTLGYLAPELLRGEAASPASDLYAVGALLHRYLYGRLPFEPIPEHGSPTGAPARRGADSPAPRRAPGDPLARQLAEDPVLAPLEGRADLVALVAQLLARHPSQRPISAAEALALLGELRLWGDQGARFAQALARTGAAEAQLVGREPLLAQFDAALDALEGAANAPPRPLLLVGARGAGKTRLLAELAVRAALRGATVYRSLRELLADPGASAAPAAAQPALVLDPQGERAAAVARVVRALGERAAQPSALLIDDLDDPLAVAALSAVARLEQPGLLVAASAASGSTAARELAAQFVGCPLDPLDEPQIATLVRSMLPCGGYADRLVGTVQRLAGGSAALATELTHVALAELAATTSPPALEQRLVAAAQTGRAAGAARLLVARLPAEQLSWAAAAALFPCGSDRTTLQGLVGEQPPSQQADEALAALLGRGVLREQDAGRLVVTDEALRGALLAQLDLASRQRLVERASRLLAGRRAPALERARLLLVGPLVPGDGPLLLEGAREARAVELSLSVLLYATAWPLLGAGEQRAVGRERVAAELALGRTSEALSLLRELTQEAPGAEQASWACELAEAQLKSGDVAGGLATLAAHPPSAPAEQALWCATRGKLLLFAAEYDRAEAEAGRMAPEAPPALRCEAQQTRGLCAFYRGRLDDALAALEQAEALARGTSDRLLQLRVTNSLGLVQQRRSAFAAARRCYESCLRLARELGHLPFEATFSMNLASVAQQQGDLAVALQGYRESVALARSFGGVRETAQAEHNLARLLATLGQAANARHALRRANALARAAGWSSLEAYNALVEAEIALQEGQPARALPELERVRAVFEASEDLVGWGDAELARARALLLLGQPARAETLARAVVERAAPVGALQVPALLLVGRAILADGAGDPLLARQVLRQALGLAEDAGEAEALIESHQLLASASARLGDEAEAAGHLQAAQGWLRAQLERLPEALQAAYLALSPRAELSTVAVQAGPAPSARAGAAWSPAAPNEPRADAPLLAALLEINQELNAQTDLRRLLERIIDHAVELTGAERGFLLLRRPGEGGGEPLELEVARNIDQESIRRGALKISRSLAEEVLASGRPVMTLDALEDERFVQSQSVHRLRLRSVLCVPLSLRREPRGVIYLDNRFRTESFSRWHQELLAALAEQVALALSTWELLEENRARQRTLEQSQAELGRVNAELAALLEEQRARVDELDELTRQQRAELLGRYQFDKLVGQSQPMQELFRLMDRVRLSDVAVLILGESGTGKELVARALHYNGARRAGPFVTVNCGAIPATLLEAELFGYEVGAFTGAQRRHRGIFERGDGGTVFLDEVGDMPPALQVKLLRVLQEKRFVRLGGEGELASDFRLLTATNKDLARLVAGGAFRQDLFYRLSVVQLALPSLRARRDDIPLLVEALLAQHGAASVAVPPAVLRRLVDYDWPGNVRQLENELLRLLALGGGALHSEDLSPALLGASARQAEVGASGPPTTLREALQRTEREQARAALAAAGGRVAGAARALGMTRVGLYKLLRRHGLAPGDGA